MHELTFLSSIVSEGLALQFVESQDEISLSTVRQQAMDDLCQSWDAYTPTEVFAQDDSGI